MERFVVNNIQRLYKFQKKKTRNSLKIRIKTKYKTLTNSVIRRFFKVRQFIERFFVLFKLWLKAKAFFKSECFEVIHFKEGDLNINIKYCSNDIVLF